MAKKLRLRLALLALSTGFCNACDSDLRSPLRFGFAARAQARLQRVGRTMDAHVP